MYVCVCLLYTGVHQHLDECLGHRECMCHVYHLYLKYLLLLDALLICNFYRSQYVIPSASVER